MRGAGLLILRWRMLRRCWFVRGWVAIVLLLLGTACSSEPPAHPSPSPVFTSDATARIATGFAEAWVQRDYDAASQLLCPGVPVPQSEIGVGAMVSSPPVDIGVASSPLADMRVTGAAERGPDPEASVRVLEPRDDFHVHFVGKMGWYSVRGSVGITLGGTAQHPCILSYGASLDSFPGGASPVGSPQS